MVCNRARILHAHIHLIFAIGTLYARIKQLHQAIYSNIFKSVVSATKDIEEQEIFTK